ncbi:uncharacterized protein [Cherax quadricarinatus]|uniref:uncharacterized protein isoform X2 n=1 Tax=Cherax quadricarinatus TaxID=27406 RepID=UPI0023788572|nr:uncharacterized protein LOC128693676 isoform X2 [Cherax quadricarinatus]
MQDYRIPKMKLMYVVVVALTSLVTSKTVDLPDNVHTHPSLLREVINISKDIQSISRKGLEYYLINYGPLVKVFVTDFMDTFGVARNLQLAIPIIVKLLIIGVYAAMQFQPSLVAFQQTAQSAYIFLKNFNTPELKIMNDLTDSVFDVLDNEVV